MSVGVTIHRDSLTWAVCSSLTVAAAAAAKEPFLFSADQ